MKAMANVNGTVTSLEDARISVLDRGFLYGDSVFETVRTYNGIPFCLDEHFARLENSAGLARFKLSQSRDFLIAEIRKTVAAANPNDDISIRLIITRGEGVMDLDPTQALTSSFVIIVKPLPHWSREYYRAGVHLFVPKTVRNAPESLDPNIKSGNYLNNILALNEAKEQGADDALFLNHAGEISECTNSNIAFLLNKTLVFPRSRSQKSSGNLKGLTKAAIQSICQKHGIACEEAPLLEADVSEAEEAFISSATREIIPVKEIRWRDGRVQEFPAGGGPLTQHLQALYKDYVSHTIQQSGKEPWFS